MLLCVFQAFEELEKLLKDRNICVAVKRKLTKVSGVAGTSDFDHIVEKLMEKPKAKGRRLLSHFQTPFISDTTVQNILNAKLFH